MKRVLFLFFLLFLITALSAQKVLYVSSNGSDTWTGSRTQPFQTVHKALEQSGVTEVRVAVGNYKISGAVSGASIFFHRLTFPMK